MGVAVIVVQAHTGDGKAGLSQAEPVKIGAVPTPVVCQLEDRHSSAKVPRVVFPPGTLRHLGIAGQECGKVAEVHPEPNAIIVLVVRIDRWLRLDRDQYRAEFDLA